MTYDKTPLRRLTPPQAFPDLDAALAASGIARKADARRNRVNRHVVDVVEPPVETVYRPQPHPAAFAGAVLGLALLGLLVFSVLKVSDASSRPSVPVLEMPTPSRDAATPVAATPPTPSPPGTAPPSTPAAPPATAVAAIPEPPSPASPPAPSTLFNAANLTAQTMVVQPPPQPAEAPEDSLRSRLHERFPLLFPEP